MQTGKRSQAQLIFENIITCYNGKIKLIPADTGITNVKLADERALNMTSMETKINANAPITCASVIYSPID